MKLFLILFLMFATLTPALAFTMPTHPPQEEARHGEQR